MKNLERFIDFFEINDYQIEVYDNKLDAQPIFIFHSNSGSAETSNNIFFSKIGEKFRIISVSLLGHGRSSWSHNPQEDYSIPGVGRFMAQFTEAYKNQFHLDYYWLIGCSISAHAIFENLSGFLSCKGMISLSAPPINAETLALAFAENEDAPLLFKPHLDKYEVIKIATYFTRFTQNIKTIIKAIKCCDPTFRENLGVSLSNGEINDEIKAVKKASFPIKFVLSREDSFLNADYFNVLAKEYGLTLDVTFVDDVGHSLILDECPITTEIIYATLNTKQTIKPIELSV